MEAKGLAWPCGGEKEEGEKQGGAPGGFIGSKDSCASGKSDRYGRLRALERLLVKLDVVLDLGSGNVLRNRLTGRELDGVICVRKGGQRVNLENLLHTRLNLKLNGHARHGALSLPYLSLLPLAQLSLVPQPLVPELTASYPTRTTRATRRKRARRRRSSKFRLFLPLTER